MENLNLNRASTAEVVDDVPVDVVGEPAAVVDRVAVVALEVMDCERSTTKRKLSESSDSSSREEGAPSVRATKPAPVAAKRKARPASSQASPSKGEVAPSVQVLAPAPVALKRKAKPDSPKATSPTPSQPGWTLVEKKKKKKKDLEVAAGTSIEKRSSPEAKKPEKASAPGKKNRKVKKTKKVLTEAVPKPSLRPLELVRADAQANEAAITGLCLDSSKKISKEVAGQIMGTVQALAGLVQELLLRNSYLEGQLSKADGEIKRSHVAAETAVSKTLRVAKQLEARAKSGAAAKRPVSTYADAVKVDLKNVPPRAVRPPQNVVRILPQGRDAKKDSDATKQAVLSLVKPAKAGIRVKGVRRIHSGGIVVETETQADLKAFTESKKLKKAGLCATLPNRRNPTLIVFDVPSKMKEEEVLSCIRKQNFSALPADAQADLRLRFKTGVKGKDRANWVIEMSPLLRQRLIANGSRVYIDWMSCRVRDFVAVTRCYKCQAFGHVSKHCKAKVEVCGHCSEKGHTFAACSNKSKPAVCLNCKNSGKSHNHKARDKSCPAYKAAVEIVVSRTNYG